jgi:hypothetical protein
MPTKPPETFTVAQANRRLPLVRRIVADIHAAYPALEAKRREAGAAGSASAARLSALRREVDLEAERIAGFVRELEQLGCSFKGFEEGLVDFPAELDGRTICLCWRLGEDRIAWWHEADRGFAGRKRLTPEIEEALGA